VWLRPAQAPRQPAPAFSRDEITQVAIDLADHGGLEAVSMRRIAARIGSAPTSLYWYFSDKEELYELMVDAVIGQVQLPERPSGNWRADLRSIASATCATLSSHPWFAQLGIHPVAGPQTLRFGATALRSFEGLDLDEETEVNILAAVNNYVSGFVQRAAAWRRFASRAAPAAAHGHDDGGPEMTAEHLAARTRLHGDESFAFGLDCLLDGFAVLVTRAQVNRDLARGHDDGFDPGQLAGIAERRGGGRAIDEWLHRGGSDACGTSGSGVAGTAHQMMEIYFT
jgi:AcrR family transcriptional regulator